MDGYKTVERIIPVETEKDLDLKFALSEAPLCLHAGGIVLGAEMGTRLFNAIVKFTHNKTGVEETVHTTTNGEFDACLPIDGDYVAHVELPGFKDETYPFTIGKGKKQFKEVRLHSAIEGEVPAEEASPLAATLQEGSVIIMDKIFYEYNKTTLNQRAVKHLEALVDFLKRYPEMEIDLAVHTDTRGEAKLNQELTDERAKHAKTYLTYRGIAAERINAFGKGETEPRNRCTEGVDCSDEEHQQNNRIEIKVRKLGKPAKP
jgi:outer membrane protein OmpA-like peptidoglycan-associated protein